MPRKTPVTWTHQEVSVLTKIHALHGDTPEGLHKTEKSFERHTPTDVRAKLIELELISKPEKLALKDPGDTQVIATRIEGLLNGYSGAYRVLVARHAIGLLQSELPKRVKKAASDG